MSNLKIYLDQSSSYSAHTVDYFFFLETLPSLGFLVTLISLLPQKLFFLNLLSWFLSPHFKHWNVSRGMCPPQPPHSLLCLYSLPRPSISLRLMTLNNICTQMIPKFLSLARLLWTPDLCISPTAFLTAKAEHAQHRQCDIQSQHPPLVAFCPQSSPSWYGKSMFSNYSGQKSWSLPWLLLFSISHSECIHKSCLLCICSVSRIWPLLITTTATVQIWVAITPYLKY